MKWSAVGPHGSEKPIALINEKGLRIGDDPCDDEEPLDTWDSDSHDTSVARFNALKRNGIQREHRRHGVAWDHEIWRFRGAPYYLDQQGERLGITKRLTDQATRNNEMRNVSQLIGHINGMYHASRKDEHGVPVVAGVDLARMSGTFDEVEKEIQKYYALAAAAQSMCDTGRKAVGLPVPDRNFKIVCKFDDPEDVPSPEELTPIVVEADGNVSLKVDSDRIPPPLSNGLAHRVQSRKHAEPAKVS